MHKSEAGIFWRVHQLCPGLTPNSALRGHSLQYSRPCGADQAQGRLYYHPGPELAFLRQSLICETETRAATNTSPKYTIDRLKARTGDLVTREGKRLYKHFLEQQHICQEKRHRSNVLTHSTKIKDT